MDTATCARLTFWERDVGGRMPPDSIRNEFNFADEAGIKLRVINLSTNSHNYLLLLNYLPLCFVLRWKVLTNFN